jgi:hypothetical protein
MLSRFWMLLIVIIAFGLVVAGCEVNDSTDDPVADDDASVAVADDNGLDEPSPVPEPTSIEVPEPTATPEPEPTATATPVLTTTPEVTATAVSTPESELRSVQLAWMFPQDDEFGVPVELYATEGIASARPSDGFVKGETFAWALTDESLLHQSFTMLTANCFEYETVEGAIEWMDRSIDRTETLITGIVRNEPIEDLGDQAQVIVGFYGSRGTVNIMSSAHVRQQAIACMYYGLDAEYDSAEQVVDIAKRIDHRVQELRTRD